MGERESNLIKRMQSEGFEEPLPRSNETLEEISKEWVKLSEKEIDADESPRENKK